MYRTARAQRGSYPFAPNKVSTPAQSVAAPATFRSALNRPCQKKFPRGQSFIFKSVQRKSDRFQPQFDPLRLWSICSLPTRGPSWGHSRFVLGAIGSFLEPFCGHLSPKIDKVSEKLTLRYPHEGPCVDSFDARSKCCRACTE